MKTTLQKNISSDMFKTSLLTATMAVCLLPLTISHAIANERIVDSGNNKAVGVVKWQKQANIDPQTLINQTIPDNRTSLFFIRPADTDGLQTSVNISVNNRYQVSLQPGNYTQVYSCAGTNQISAVITGEKSNNLIKDANTFDLAPNGAYFFYVDVDNMGNEKVQQITQQSAEQVLASKQYQQHQISRVVPNCPTAVSVPPQPIVMPMATIASPTPERKPEKLTEQVSIDLKVLFDNAKAEIKPAYYQEVQAVADFMKQYPNTVAVIEGHTDSQGKSAYNQKLSQQRADAVKQLLQQQFGIEASRLQAVGYGESKPVASNDTASGREQNRRVVAVINER